MPVRKMDRSVLLAWLAMNEARVQAKLESAPSGLRVGLMVGTSRGSIGKLQEGFTRLHSQRYRPSLATDCTIASISGALAQRFGATGPCATISATCASAAYAIGFAAEQLALGKADVMLVGGAEAPLVPDLIVQMHAARLLGSHLNPACTCRPFDVTRNGLCLGEASAFLVLESRQSARARRVSPLARLAGWGMAVDHSGRAGVQEDGSGLLNAAGQALLLANLDAPQIDYLNTHGTGTMLNDRVEAAVLARLLGPHAPSTPCTSTKPVTGHCLGATPALEAVICVAALQHQLVPPTANCFAKDPAFAIDVVPHTARAAILRHVMSNSLGFWGYHASLIFSTIDSG